MHKGITSVHSVDNQYLVIWGCFTTAKAHKRPWSTLKCKSSAAGQMPEKLNNHTWKHSKSTIPPYTFGTSSVNCLRTFIADGTAFRLSHSHNSNIHSAQLFIPKSDL